MKDQYPILKEIKINGKPIRELTLNEINTILLARDNNNFPIKYGKEVEDEIDKKKDSH